MVAMRDVHPGSIRSDLYSISTMEDSNSSQFNNNNNNNSNSNSTSASPCVLSVVSSLLERVVARNERLLPLSPEHTRRHAVFYGTRAPSVSIEQYLERIFKYANCSPSCFVVAYVYMDRMMQRQPQLRVTYLTVHRLFLTSLMLATKFLDDLCYDNAFFAKIGGLTTKEINKMELDFLFLIGFKLQVTVSVFESYCSHLEREVALGGGYQIERALRSICGLDKTSHNTKLIENISSRKQRLGRCYGGS